MVLVKQGSPPQPQLSRTAVWDARVGCSCEQAPQRPLRALQCSLPAGNSKPCTRTAGACHVTASSAASISTRSRSGYRLLSDSGCPLHRWFLSFQASSEAVLRKAKPECLRCQASGQNTRDPGIVPGQAGWGLELPGLVECAPAHCRELERGDFPAQTIP